MDVDNQMAKLQADLNTLRQNINAVQRREEKCELHHNTLTASLAKAVQKCEVSESDLTQGQASLKEKKICLQQLQQEWAENEEELGKIARVIAARNKGYLRLDALIKDSQRQIAEMKQQPDSPDERSEMSMRQLQQYEETAKQEQLAIQALKETAGILSSNKNSLQVQVHASMRSLPEMDTLNRKLKQLNDECNAKRDSVQSSLVDMERHKQSIRKLNEKLTKEYQDKLLRVEQLQASAQELKAQDEAHRVEQQAQVALQPQAVPSAYVAEGFFQPATGADLIPGSLTITALLIIFEAQLAPKQKVEDSFRFCVELPDIERLELVRAQHPSPRFSADKYGREYVVSDPLSGKRVRASFSEMSDPPVLSLQNEGEDGGEVAVRRSQSADFTSFVGGSKALSSSTTTTTTKTTTTTTTTTDAPIYQSKAEELLRTGFEEFDQDFQLKLTFKDEYRNIFVDQMPGPVPGDATSPRSRRGSFMEKMRVGFGVGRLGLRPSATTPKAKTDENKTSVVAGFVPWLIGHATKRDNVFIFRATLNRLETALKVFNRSVELYKKELVDAKVDPESVKRLSIEIEKERRKSSDEYDDTENVTMVGVAGCSDALGKKLLKLVLNSVPFSLVVGGHWSLIYSMSKHGASLNRFFEATRGKRNTMVVFVDENKNVFGGFKSDPWQERDEDRAYYGTGDTFVWHVDQNKRFHRHGWTGVNNFFSYSTRTKLAFGGGNNFAISIDEELRKGTSGQCETFDSPRFTKNEDYMCMVFEVWSCSEHDYDYMPSENE